MDEETKRDTKIAIGQHRYAVQRAMRAIIDPLIQRANEHDLSKFEPDELEGFARIRGVACEHPYGSDEYRAALKAEKPTIERHYARNSHHPEHWDRPDHNIGPGMMGLLDVIEMVCDWWGAWKCYEAERAPEHRSTWQQNMDRQRGRFLKDGRYLSYEQWWAVEQVVALLEAIDL